MKKRLFVLSIVVLSLILYCGCSPEAVPAKSGADAVLSPAVQTSQATAEPTPTEPTPTEPTPTEPIPTAPLSTALTDNSKTASPMSELDQQISAFLNKTGEYSEENMKKRVITKHDGGETKLGLINHYDEIYLECWLFDFQQQDDYIKLIVGLDGKDNQRFVTALAVPLYNYDGDMKFLECLKLLSNSMSSDMNEDEYLSLYTPSEISKKFGSMKNSPFVCYFSLEKFTDFEDYDDASKRFLKECNSTLDLAKSLISEAAKNDVDTDLKSSDRSIIKITSAADIDKIDIADIPIIQSEFYY